MGTVVTISGGIGTVFPSSDTLMLASPAPKMPSRDAPITLLVSKGKVSLAARGGVFINIL